MGSSFPNLSILCSVFPIFTYVIVNIIQSSVKLIVDCDSPLVDATLRQQLVSSLIYLAHNMITDISFFVSMVLRFMQIPLKSH